MMFHTIAGLADRANGGKGKPTMASESPPIVAFLELVLLIVKDPISFAVPAGERDQPGDRRGGALGRQRGVDGRRQRGELIRSAAKILHLSDGRKAARMAGPRFLME
jgi:hypothetical protein